MKNRLSTLLMVLLTAFMVNCSGCGTTPTPDPVLEGTWNIVSITATNGLQPKYSQALGTPANGTMIIAAAETSLNKPNAGGVTTDGKGAAVITKSDVSTGTIAIAFAQNPATFNYTELGPNRVVLSGNATSSKTTVNTTVIVLSR